MSEDRSWGADTVAFGRASREPPAPAPSSAPPARPKLPTIALRPLALVTVAIVAVAALIVAGRGSDSQKAPIREVADPAPRVVVKQAPRVRRREPRDVAKPRVHEKGAGQLENERGAETKRETQAPPTPEYVPAREPETPSPQPPPPTSPAAEFGM